jgi:hypothetical protein
MPRLTETQVEWGGAAHDPEKQEPFCGFLIMGKDRHGCVASDG